MSGYLWNSKIPSTHAGKAPIIRDMFMRIFPLIGQCKGGYISMLKGVAWPFHTPANIHVSLRLWVYIPIMVLYWDCAD